MEELFANLSFGVVKDDISKDELELINLLETKGIVKLKKGKYKLDSKYKIGKIDVARNGTGYLEVFTHKKVKDIVIESHDLAKAGKNDIVVAERFFSKSNRPKAKVVYIIKKEFETSVVYTKKIDNKVFGFNIKTDLQTDIKASNKSLKTLPLNTVLKIDNYTSKILEVLGVLDDPKVDEKISLALYNRKSEFSNRCEVEAKSHGDFVDKTMYVARDDLTHLPFCTIDPPDAKDFDDAIFFDTKRNTIYVAIADVSEYVFPMGAVDKEALDRGFSIYFPHKSIPMLPRTLSENICSLKPNEDRLGFAFKIKIDPKSYEVISEKLVEVIINSKRRYTYDRVDQFLNGNFDDCDKTDHEILKYLLPLNEILNGVRQKRLANSFEFSSMDIRMSVDENQNLKSTSFEEETPSHKLIEDAMLLANKAAAKMFKRGIYRVHEEPSPDKISEMINNLNSIGLYALYKDDIYSFVRELQQLADEQGIRKEVDKLIIKSQKKASYSSENIGHFGLGFDKYTHFTSPIRRYSDLVVHRLLKAIVRDDKKLTKYILSDIDQVAKKVSLLERDTAKVAWDYLDRKYARWAKENIGKKFKAIIVDTDRNPIAIIEDEVVGARVFLTDLDVELFEKIEIEIVEANIATTKIIGRICTRMS